MYKIENIEKNQPINVLRNLPIGVDGGGGGSQNALASAIDWSIEYEYVENQINGFTHLKTIQLDNNLNYFNLSLMSDGQSLLISPRNVGKLPIVNTVTDSINYVSNLPISTDGTWRTIYVDDSKAVVIPFNHSVGFIVNLTDGTYIQTQSFGTSVNVTFNGFYDPTTNSVFCSGFENGKVFKINADDGTVTSVSNTFRGFDTQQLPNGHFLTTSSQSGTAFMRKTSDLSSVSSVSLSASVNGLRGQVLLPNRQVMILNGSGNNLVKITVGLDDSMTAEYITNPVQKTEAKLMPNGYVVAVMSTELIIIDPRDFSTILTYDTGLSFGDAIGLTLLEDGTLGVFSSNVGLHIFSIDGVDFSGNKEYTTHHLLNN